MALDRGRGSVRELIGLSRRILKDELISAKVFLLGELIFMGRIGLLFCGALLLTVASSLAQEKVYWCQVDDQTGDVVKCYFDQWSCKANGENTIAAQSGQEPLDESDRPPYTCKTVSARG